MIVLRSHTVESLEGDVRFIDYVIGVFAELATRNSVKNAIAKKELRHNNSFAKTGTYVNPGDTIELVDMQYKTPKEFPLQIEIVYEDEFLLIVNKPSGLVVSGNIHRTLENALIGQHSLSKEDDALKWAKPVHRLDAATSGLMILSKTISCHRKLMSMFENQQINKSYRAVVHGLISEELNIDFPIDQKDSISFIKPIRNVASIKSGELTLLELMPKTGRTHQLRIHCSKIGHSIVGDPLYSIASTISHKGLLLASVALSFVHPQTNQQLDVSINEPKKFQALMDREQKRWEKYNPA